jgi:RND family efflux transporter MFP subunit
MAFSFPERDRAGTPVYRFGGWRSKKEWSLVSRNKSIVGLQTNLRSQLSPPLSCALLILAMQVQSGCAAKKVETAPPPPPDVEVVQVTPQDVPITKEWVAVLKGAVNASIRSQVAGYLLKQDYMNGAVVRKGQVLFEIDPRPFQVSVDQAKANLEQAKGAVDQAKANLEEAKAKLLRAEAGLGKTVNDVTRYTPLAKAQAVPQQDLDNAIQANLAAKAEVEAAKASIGTATAAIAAHVAAANAAQAAVDTAQLNLGFTKVTSLIDGVAGIANAQVGDLVGPESANPLTTVSTIDPMLAQFAASEQEYLKALAGFGGSTRAEAALRAMSFELVLADGSVYPQKGRLEYIDREVDVRTGSINIQVTFPNSGNVLRPGGYGNIRTVVRTQKGALAVPQRSITDLQGRSMVAVVGSDGKVVLRQVKTGEKVGTLWVIEDGLKAGEQVVAEGTQKVREGTQVNPRPYQSGAKKASS